VHIIFDRSANDTQAAVDGHAPACLCLSLVYANKDTIRYYTMG